MKSNNKKISKFLSLVLRHKPETIKGLILDENGWAAVEVLLQGMNDMGLEVSLEALKEVVESNDKQRFKFNDDCTKIRANQGHSIKVELQLQPKVPPPVLYHGTAIQNLVPIKQEGLTKQKRHHVHLSSDRATAKKVGMRHGKPIILEINAGRMHSDGIDFYLSENGVWLTSFVDTKYIEFGNEA